MSDHLPDCLITGPVHPDDVICICDRLRACEQRGREEQASEELALREQTWLMALDRATEAVADIPASAFDIGIVTRDDILAAIDALRGES